MILTLLLVTIGNAEWMNRFLSLFPDNLQRLLVRTLKALQTSPPGALGTIFKKEWEENFQAHPLFYLLTPLVWLETLFPLGEPKKTGVSKGKAKEASPILWNEQEDRPVFDSLRIAVIFSGKGNHPIH